jgi:hypothetical protein
MSSNGSKSNGSKRSGGTELRFGAPPGHDPSKLGSKGDASPAASAAKAEPAPAPASGLEPKSPSDKGGTNEPIGDGARAVQLIDLSQLAGLKDALSQAVAEGLAPMQERMLHLETELMRERSKASAVKFGDGSEADDDGSGTERGYEHGYYDDDASSDVSYSSTGTEYCRLRRTSSHWLGRRLADSPDQCPRRSSLYGYKPHDLLSAGKNGPGNLGRSLTYLEPICAFAQSALSNLSEVIDEMGSRNKHSTDLCAIWNTQSEVYNLCNELRQIICEQARALRPGASEYDKLEVQYILRTLDENDFADEDLPSLFARLKKHFAADTNRAERKQLAARASNRGGGGGGGGGRRDDDEEHGHRKKSHKNKRDDERDSPRERERPRGERRDNKSKGSGSGSKGNKSDSKSRNKPDRDRREPKSKKDESSHRSSRRAERDRRDDDDDGWTRVERRRGADKHGGGGNSSSRKGNNEQRRRRRPAHSDTSSSDSSQ